MPFPLSPQSIGAIADIISGGGRHDTTHPIGIYRSGPNIQKFMRTCNVALKVNGSRVSALVQCLINLNNGFEMPWHNGQVDDQINPLNTLKRLIYGRAGRTWSWLEGYHSTKKELRMTQIKG